MTIKKIHPSAESFFWEIKFDIFQIAERDCRRLLLMDRNVEVPSHPNTHKCLIVRVCA